MNKHFVYIMTLILILTLFMPAVIATESDDVILLISGDKEIYAKNTELTVDIHFNNTNIYNQNLYLSYHIFLNQQDNRVSESVQYENVRIPIILDDSLSASIQIPVDLDSKELNEYKQLYLKFDIIDEENIFWYSQSDIKMNVGTVVYVDDFFKRQIMLIRDAFKINPVIFIVNILITLLAICSIILIKKRELI